MVNVTPGKFRFAVELKRFVEQRSPSGDFEQGEAAVSLRRFASIQSVTGREAIRARVVEADVSHIVQVQTDSKVVAVTPEYQIHYDDKWLGKVRIFEILSARQLDEEQRVTEFICKELVA